MTRQALVLVLALMPACVVEVGSGRSAVETRQVAPFEAVALSNFVTVEVVHAEHGSIELTCDDNLLEHIVTDVVDDTLGVRTRQGVTLQSRTDCRLRVFTPHLEHITASGSGDVMADGGCACLRGVSTSGSGGVFVESAEGSNVDLHISGSGDIFIDHLLATSVSATSSGSGSVQIAGQADTLSLHTSGSGTIDGSELRALHGTASVSGSGDVSLFVTDTLDARTSGSGDVHVFGDPLERSDNSSGSGDVIYN